MKRIVKNADKLREACAPIKFITENGVDKNHGIEVVNALKDVMEAKPELTALSAPQIGYKDRVFCIRFSDGIKTFMNPIITKKAAPKFICETSVSFPTKQIMLLRPTEIEVKYYTDEFKYEDNKLMGAAAGLFDQQYQFLDGLTPLDLGLVSDVNEDGIITDEDLADEEFMSATYELYKKLVAKRAEDLTAEVTSNETDAKLYQQLAFTESVINGRTQVIDSEVPAPTNRAQRRAAEKMSRKIEAQTRKHNNKINSKKETT